MPGMRNEKSVLDPDIPREAVVLRMRGVLNFEYEVVRVERPLLDPEEGALARALGDRPALFVLDREIEKIYGARLALYVAANGLVAHLASLPGEESSKTWSQVEAVVREAIRCELPRHGVIVALGGGVVLDVAGLAATVYRRGVSYVRVPTSLIGLVDAGLGIKHGVNYEGQKSIVGSFYPPEAVIADPSFLATLDRRHLTAGMAEIVKLGVIRDRALLDLLYRSGEELIASRFQGEPAVASAVLHGAAQALLQALEGNLFERELRRPLDFGHSFSPAIESASGYAVAHGEAVAMDMALSLAIALRRGLCAEGDVRFLFALFRRLGLPIEQSVCGAAELTAALAAVRRHRGGALHFVVPTEIGRVVFLEDVARPDVELALADCASAARGGG